MKKLVLEIMRSDIDRLIEGLQAFSYTFDNAEEKSGMLDLGFIQNDEYLVVLTIDKKGKIIK